MGPTVNCTSTRIFWATSKHDFRGRVFLKAFAVTTIVVRGTWQTGDHVSAVGVGGGRSSQTATCVGNDHVGPGDSGARLVAHGAADVAGVLCGRSGGQGKRDQQHAEPQPGGSQNILSTIGNAEFSFTLRPPGKIRIWGDVEMQRPGAEGRTATPEVTPAQKAPCSDTASTTRRPRAPYLSCLLKRVNSAFNWRCQAGNSG